MHWRANAAGRRRQLAPEGIKSDNWAIYISLWIQVTAFVFLVTVIALISIAIITAVQARSIGSTLVEAKFSDYAFMKATEIENSLNDLRNDLAWSLSRPVVTEFLSTEEFNSTTMANVSSYITSIVSSRSYYWAVLIYDQDLNLNYSLIEADTGASLAQTLSSLASLLPLNVPGAEPPPASAGIINGPVPLLSFNSTVLFAFSITMAILKPDDKNADPLGYASVVLNADILTFIDSSKAPYELGKSQVTIAEPVLSRAFHVLVTTGADSLAAVGSTFNFSSYPAMYEALNLARSSNDTASRSVVSKRDTRTLYSESAAVGCSYLAVSRNRLFLFCVETSSSSAFAPVRNLSHKLVGIFVGVLGAVFLIIVPLGRKLTKPLYVIYGNMRLKSTSSISSNTLDDESSGDSDPKRKEISFEKASVSPQALRPKSLAIVLPRRNTTVESCVPEDDIEGPPNAQVSEKLPKLRRIIRDEIDDLVREYNAMVDRLNNYHEYLNDEVRIRTHEAQEAQLIAEEANAAKSQFIANISHELRTPLNGIMGMTSVCLTESDPAKIHSSLEIIIQSGKVLMELLTELLAFSRSQVDRDPEVTESSVSELLDGILSSYQARAEAKSVSMTLVFKPPYLSSLRFRGDVLRATQVVLGFISNSIKFAEPGSAVSVTVALRSAETDPHISLAPYTSCGKSIGESVKVLEITVRDNGIGITKDILKQIFEPFIQGEDALSKRYQGTGLGMSMSKQLAEIIGGYIIVLSSESIGTSVTIRFPISVIDSNLRLSALETEEPILFENAYCTESYNAGNLRFVQTPPVKGGGNRPLPPRLEHHSLFPHPHSDNESLPGSSSVRSQSIRTSTAMSGARSVGSNLPVPPNQHMRHVSNVSKRASWISSLWSTFAGEGASPVHSKHPSESCEEVANEDDTRSTCSKTPSSEPPPVTPLPLGPGPGPVAGVKSPMSPASDLVRDVKLLHNHYVLVVDDNALNLDIMVRMLHKMGVKCVDGVSDGQSAVDRVADAIARNTHYTVIFMDLMMSGVDGFEAARVIRNELGYEYPIVALTGFSDEKTINDCYTANIQEVMNKPVMPKTLLRVLLQYGETGSHKESR